MRTRRIDRVLSAAVAGLVAVTGCSGDTAGTSSGTSGRGGSSTTTGPTGTATGGAGGTTTGGSGGSGGAGASGGATGTGGATGSGGSTGVGGAGGNAGMGGNAGTGGAGGVTDAGAPSDARGPADIADARDSADARASSDVADAGGGTDAVARDVSITDASSGDAGPSPYKGVANSPCAEMAMLGATWFYNWGLSRGNCATPEFVPMVWGHTGSEQTAAGITSAINTLVTSGYKTVLGFNEPDNSNNQSNISVANAIALWPSFNNPAIRIGSPATSANAAGQIWFQDFMSQVNADTTGTLRVDFIAAHWYGWNAGSCEPNASSLEGYIKTIEMIPGNRPIWLTEWGCLYMSNPDSATVVAFFKGAVAMFARHPRIERYAWYPWTPYNELFLEGGISPMGTAFADAPQYK